MFIVTEYAALITDYYTLVSWYINIDTHIRFWQWYCRANQERQ